MKLVIEGVRVISKKNSRVLVSRGRKLLNVPSAAYARFEREAGLQLNTQWDHHVISKPFALRCAFIMKGKNDTDVDNMFTSVLDLLAHLGMISNDKLCVEGSMTKKLDGEEYHTTIVLEEK